MQAMDDLERCAADDPDEAVVGRAARDAVSEWAGWRAEDQAHVRGLVTGGKHPVRMRPDFVIRDEDGDIRLVGDAKWKVGTPSQSDIYQLTAYQLADDVPGFLTYPAQDGTVAIRYTVRDRFPLSLIELPTDATTPSYDAFTGRLRHRMRVEIADLIERDEGGPE